MIGTASAPAMKQGGSGAGQRPRPLALSRLTLTLGRHDTTETGQHGILDG